MREYCNGQHSSAKFSWDSSTCTMPHHHTYYVTSSYILCHKFSRDSSTCCEYTVSVCEVCLSSIMGMPLLLYQYIYTQTHQVDKACISERFRDGVGVNNIIQSSIMGMRLLLYQCVCVCIYKCICYVVCVCIYIYI